MFKDQTEAMKIEILLGVVIAKSSKYTRSIVVSRACLNLVQSSWSPEAK